MAFAPQKAAPRTPSQNPVPPQPTDNAFNRWVRTRSKWFWVCTIAVAWVIGFGISALTLQDEKPTNRDAGYQNGKAMDAKGLDEKSPEPDQSNASSTEAPAQPAGT